MGIGCAVSFIQNVFERNALRLDESFGYYFVREWELPPEEQTDTGQSAGMELPALLGAAAGGIVVLGLCGVVCVRMVREDARQKLHLE